MKLPSKPDESRQHRSFFSFQKKLLLYFVLCAVIPSLVVGLLSYQTSYSIAKEKMLDSISLTGRQIAFSIDNRLQQIEYVADSVQFSMYTLESTPQIPYSEYLTTAEQIKSSTASLSHAFNILHTNIFLDGNIIISQERYVYYPLSELKQYHLISESELKGTGSQSLWKFSPEQVYPYDVSNKPVPSLICFRSKKNINTSAIDYVYTFSLDCSEFSDMLSSVYSDSGVSACLLEVSSNRQIASTRESRELSPEALQLIRDNSQSFQLADYEYIVHQTSNPDWKIVTQISNQHIRNGSWVLVKIIIFGLVSVLAVTLCVMVFVSRNITYRLNRLSDIISRTGTAPDNNHLQELKFAFSKNRRSHDEIDILADTYGNMIKTIQQNFEQILGMHINEERLKYQLLQSQINPHFLYNMLQSIQTCQTAGRIDSANQMTTGLAKFYRHILRKQDDLIPIRDEIEILQLYLEMESFCHNSNLEWIIELDEDIENFKICRFTLQPIVENAIVHGISSSNDKITIHISVCYGEDDINIIIADNGCGMTPERLVEVREALQNQQTFDDKHFGLGNVAARLANVRPEYGSISIDSTQQMGTTISVKIQQIL